MAEQMGLWTQLKECGLKEVSSTRAARLAGGSGGILGPGAAHVCVCPPSIDHFVAPHIGSTQMSAKKQAGELALEGGSADSLGDFAKFGIVTVSDRASTGVYEDASGPAILQFFHEAIKSRCAAALPPPLAGLPPLPECPRSE